MDCPLERALDNAQPITLYNTQERMMYPPSRKLFNYNARFTEIKSLQITKRKYNPFPLPNVVEATRFVAHTFGDLAKPYANLYRYANLPCVACFVLLQHSDVIDFFSTCNVSDFEIDTVFALSAMCCICLISLPFRLIVRFSSQYRDLADAMLLGNLNLAARFHGWFLSYLKGAAFAVH
uniref:Uncharacterized protein n=1 Tax=Glossina pallidipes TaxID=7398 RepID=A0A1A9ZPT7_GLOPL